MPIHMWSLTVFPLLGRCMDSHMSKTSTFIYRSKRSELKKKIVFIPVSSAQPTVCVFGNGDIVDSAKFTEPIFDLIFGRCCV